MYTVTGWTFFALCMAATIASLATFRQLQERIQAASVANGFRGAAADLQILDLRNGYQPQEVAELLGAWGPVGRRLYLAIELVDVSLYHFAYRGAFLVLCNRLASALGARWPAARPAVAWFPAVPVVLAGLDLAEDVSQVVLTLLFEAAPGVALGGGSLAWRAAVGVASTLNVAKWALVRAGSTCLLMAAVVVGAERALRC